MQSDEIPELLIKYLLKKYQLLTVDYHSMDALSELLKTNHNVTISGNTLARLCRLRKDSTTPYPHTLDSLAIAAGYINYPFFVSCMNARNIIHWSNTEESEMSFISQYTLKAAREGDVKFMESLSKHIEDKGCELNTSEMLSGAILNGLRTNDAPKKLLEFMATSPIMVDMFFECFVDESYFNAYFGEGMVQLAKHTKELNRTYLFANSIAMMYEKNRGLTQEYHKRAKRMATIDLNYVDELFAANCPYPPARWLGVMIDYWLLQNEIQKASLLFDYAIQKAQSIPSDEAIIIISQLTEIGELLPIVYIHQLRKLYLQKSKNVLYEMVSLVNAALNLSLLLPTKVVITKGRICELFSNYPALFRISKQVLETKMNRAFNHSSTCH